MYNTIILTGVPRSGSSLSCSLLNNYENTIALLEPMPVFDSNPEKGNIQACKDIVDFEFKCREDILYYGLMQTRSNNGKELTNTFLDSLENNNLRKAIINNTKINIKAGIKKDFTLAIKHTAFFTAILEDLNNFFECYATIRNPLSVLASWSTIDVPVNKGHIPAAERYDAKLKQKLMNTDSVLNRQIIILDWFFDKYKMNLDNEHIIKYEDVITDNENIFNSLSYNGKLDKKSNKLANKNINSQYSNVDIDNIYNVLINSEGAYWDFYSKEEVDSIYMKLKK